MKLSCTIGAFFLAIVLLTSSCKKNKLDQPGFPGLRCNPGDIEYISDTAFYTRSPHTIIHAQTGGQDRIVIYLLHDTTGVVNLDSTSNTAYYLDGVNTYRSYAGSVNITQYYNDSLRIMSGSFGFNAKATNDPSKTINVSYGYFNNIPRH